ncbi:MAG: flagellar basal body rod protein FlgB [Myxococcales bacterium]|nr:flagellar basal body rod protein FlgB [Myxococcales bacterium]
MSVPSFDPLIGGMRTVLDLRFAQHAVTASNLANADTPGFRASVVDFTHVLARAVGEEGPDLSMRRTDARHLDPHGIDPHRPPLVELDPPPWSVDGNSVVPERETARMSANALMYDAVAQGLGRKLSLLELAVSDGRA